MPFAHSETPEHVRTTLGAILRRRRELTERSLHDVARPAGISPAFLSEVERGRKEISTEKLLAVARALEASIGELYLELAHELGAGGPEWEGGLAVDTDPRLQLRRMSEALNPDALRAAARFTTFLAFTEPGAARTEADGRRRPIGFLR